MNTLFSAAIRSAGIICLSSIPALLHAAESNTNHGAVSNDPIDIIITAGRKAQTVDESLAAVTVISRDEIKRSQAQDVETLLRRIPGLSIKNSGGIGQQTSIQMRGANANQTLVMVDGVKINSLTAGVAQLQYMPVAQIERIEVVRGARSSLYGSEAIGGVVHIITRKGTQGFKPGISVSAGSHQHKAADLNIAGGNDQGWYNLNISSLNNDGIDAQQPNPFSMPGDEDSDAFRRETLSLKTGYRFTPNTSGEFALVHAQGNTQYDGFTNSVDYTLQTVNASLNHAWNDKVSTRFSLGQSRDDTSNFQGDGTLNGQYDTRRRTHSVQTDIQLTPDSDLILGIDQQDDRIADSDIAYSKTRRKNTGLFASYQQQFGANNLEAALRRDKDDQFGTATTGNLAFGHDFANGLRIRAGYGTAFKAPTFNDLYYPSSAFYSPNPNLKPEKADQVEMGVSGNNWEITAFETKVDDLITYVANPVTFAGTMENVNKARIRGIEASTASRLGAWDVTTNLTLQQAKDRNSGNRLTYRPAQLLNIDADRQFGKAGIGASLHAESKRYSDASNTEANALPGYATLDLRASYQLAKDWTISAKVGNVLDKAYETNRGYNQDGRNGLITLSYSPE